MERLLDARGLRLGRAGPRGAASTLRWGLPPLLRRRAVRRRALAVLALVALLLLAWMGIKRSPLVSVTHVRVSGVHGLESAAIRSALERAARHQSTLAVDRNALRAAVAPFGLVRDLRVKTSLPHTLSIAVIERLPVAMLVAGGAHIAVAGDGTLLGPSLSDVGGPAISVATLPVGHVSDPALLSEVEALGAAPPALLRRVGRVLFGPQGLTVTMRNGLQLYFGDSAHAHAKWIAATLVIGDPAAAGATYVDLRTPDRPAAGGLSPGAGAASSVAGAATAGSSTQAGLAAQLATALASSSTPTTAGASPPGATITPVTPAPAGAAGPTTAAPGTTSSSTGG